MKHALRIFLGLALVAAALLWSADLGQAPVRLGSVLRAWASGEAPPTALESTIVSLRLRRGLMACLVGAALSLAGCGLQGLLRNPLGDPYLLGISGGASLGSVLGMAWISSGGSNWLLPEGNFAVIAGASAGALFSTYLVYGLARVNGRLEIRSMLLSGVVLQTFLGAILLMIWTVLDRSVVNAHIQWLTGRIPDPPEAEALVMAGLATGIGWVGLRLQAKAYNALCSGEQGAAELGIDVERVKRWTFLLCSLITGVIVSHCGLISFVGLIVPHTTRLLLGADHRRLIPAVAFLGALFLLSCDTAARALFGTIVMPVGAITALCGGPFFLFLLRRRAGGGVGLS